MLDKLVADCVADTEKLPTEYTASNELSRVFEYRYPHLNHKFTTPNIGKFFNVMHLLCAKFNMQHPILTVMPQKYCDKFGGLYIGWSEDTSQICIRHDRGITTLIHELSHHYCMWNHLNTTDNLSLNHGDQFMHTLRMFLVEYAVAYETGVL